MADEQDRIAKALEYARLWGAVEGGHHKQWVIDQMVRALTGCPVVIITETNVPGTPYAYEGQGESDEYRAWVADFEIDEGEGMEYEPWDRGIAP